ncbi:MAG TPA: response regulator [Halomicronema sp.]
MNKPIIICVDDEQTILQSLKIELKKNLAENYLIETCETSQDALDLLEELLKEGREIPVIISDYLMPGIKGDELLKEIHHRSPQTLKILLTGQADLAAVSNAIKYAKLYRYIPKPWQPEDLSLTVKEALRSYAQEKQIAQQNLTLQRLNQQLENLIEQRTAALRLSEEKFAKAFKNSPNPITITRLSDGCHLEVNDAFCQNLGYTPQEIIGHSALELGFWVNLKDRIALFEALQQKGSIHNYEFDFRTKTGQIKTGLLSAEIIEIGGETCVISVSQDITQRKITENALQKAKEEADKANRAKSEFLSNMSHELRTPLNAILGFTQLLTRDTTLKAEQQQQLEIISRSGEHLLSLINNILQMSKIEVGLITLDKKPFDFYRLLNSLEEMLSLQAQKKDLQLIFDLSPDLPQYIKTDESKLRQILLNLLGNAIKFTSEGGVTLRIKHQTPNQNNSNSLTILFEIEDTGPGIESTEITQLFTPFIQTESGRKSQEGTGLGLPISREFIKLMDGNISVNSIINQGTLFKFHIQTELINSIEIQATATKQRVISIAPNQPEYRILVVDDRLESRLLLVKLLESLGFKAKEAENGLKAIEIWSEWEPHLIWMDMRMPVMDGYEATKQIKSHLKGQATVIIALTASAFEEEKSIVLSAGCQDFVAKPFREEVILEKMTKYLGVQYTYQEQTLNNPSQNSTEPNSQTETPTAPFTLQPSSFNNISPQWIDQLYNAALCVDDEEIAQILTQLTPHQTPLATAIMNLVENFRCDQILDLIEEYKNSQNVSTT